MMLRVTFGKILIISLVFLFDNNSVLAQEHGHAEPAAETSLPEAPQRKLLWGDTHLHTSYSVDAFLNRNISADPDTAYRFAKGQPVVHPHTRARVQIETPLDFLVVSDHAEFLGTMREIYHTGVPREGLGIVDRFLSWLMERQVRSAMEKGEGVKLFTTFIPKAGDPAQSAGVSAEGGLPGSAQIIASSWVRSTNITEQHNEPGKFTALVGWEWTSNPGGANLHRVVFSNTDAKTAQTFIPYGSDISVNPEDLWAWLEETSEKTGAGFVSIPHNSNISKGYMFPDTTFRGNPMTEEHAKFRLEWEPVVEMTQVKGDSETHPALSGNDEFADFETYAVYIQRQKEEYVPRPGDYIRSSLKRGLEIEQKVGANPYKFGLIGSTDSHTGLSTAEENNFLGKYGSDSLPEFKKIPFAGDDGIAVIGDGWSMSASGLAGVWAQENDRTSIMNAFRRKEVYATSGPRIRLRMFGGWEFSPSDASAKDIARVGYARGVPMGGDLSNAPEGRAPTFLVHAVKDAKSGNLDRIQIVKGWLGEDGKAREKVYDAVWAGPRKPGADGKLPPVGNTVNVRDGTYTNTIGDIELTTVWTDPDFRPDQRSFYYARVLQIPTPRHSLLDALALGQEPEGKAVIQERAYSSPVWYTP